MFKTELGNANALKDTFILNYKDQLIRNDLSFLNNFYSEAYDSGTNLSQQAEALFKVLSKLNIDEHNILTAIGNNISAAFLNLLLFKMQVIDLSNFKIIDNSVLLNNELNKKESLAIINPDKNILGWPNVFVVFTDKDKFNSCCNTSGNLFSKTHVDIFFDNPIFPSNWCAKETYLGNNIKHITIDYYITTYIKFFYQVDGIFPAIFHELDFKNPPKQFEIEFTY